jgi:hypothetical protein
MYIICAVITIPIGLLGRFIIPGTIAMSNRLVLNNKDFDIARKRLEKSGHVVQAKLKLHHIKEIFLSKYFYVVVFVDVLFWNAGSKTGAFFLWLKSLNRPRSYLTINSIRFTSRALKYFFFRPVIYDSSRALHLRGIFLRTSELALESGIPLSRRITKNFILRTYMPSSLHVYEASFFSTSPIASRCFYICIFKNVKKNNHRLNYYTP